MAEIAVAPFVGAWIETVKVGTYDEVTIVAPFVGAWIETACDRADAGERWTSLPSWERGLKRLV